MFYVEADELIKNIGAMYTSLELYDTITYYTCVDINAKDKLTNTYEVVPRTMLQNAHSTKRVL